MEKLKPTNFRKLNAKPKHLNEPFGESLSWPEKAEYYLVYRPHTKNYNSEPAYTFAVVDGRLVSFCASSLGGARIQKDLQYSHGTGPPFSNRQAKQFFGKPDKIIEFDTEIE